MPTKAEKELRDAHPNAWIAIDEGDRLTGTVDSITRAYSDARARNGDGYYPLLQVKTADDLLLAFHAFGTVAYNRVLELRPRPGEAIEITYQGLGKKKEGMNAPKLFHIVLPDRDPVEQANDVYNLFGDARSNAQPATSEPVRTVNADDDIPF